MVEVNEKRARIDAIGAQMRASYGVVCFVQYFFEILYDGIDYIVIFLVQSYESAVVCGQSLMLMN